MPRRHRAPGGSGAAVALRTGLLVLAAAVLGGVWYFVKQRSDPAPAVEPEVGLGQFDAVVPWDSVEIDEPSGAFIMIVEAPVRWDLTPEELDEFFGNVEACRDFAGASLAAFYPEAKGRPVRVRIHCAAPPPAPALDRLRAIARTAGAVAYDLATEGAGGRLELSPLE